MLKFLVRTAFNAAKKPGRFLMARVNRLRFRCMTVEERFNHIYEANHWESDESRSGVGSTLQYTANLRNCLPSLLEAHGIKKMLDAPCGDFNWMRHVLPFANIDYTGGDLVSAMINENNNKYKSDSVRFVVLDMLCNDLPAVDVLMCRDLLFHLSDSDIHKVLKNFALSGIPLLFTSNHINNLSFSNSNIISGGFRRIDLFSAPYNFPRDPLSRILDYVHPYPPREMCLFTREQVIFSISNWGF